MWNHIKLSYEAARENTFLKNHSIKLNWFGKMFIMAMLMLVLPLAFIIEVGIKHDANEL